MLADALDCWDAVLIGGQEHWCVMYTSSGGVRYRNDPHVYL